MKWNLLLLQLLLQHTQHYITFRNENLNIFSSYFFPHSHKHTKFLFNFFYLLFTSHAHYTWKIIDLAKYIKNSPPSSSTTISSIYTKDIVPNIIIIIIICICICVFPSNINFIIISFFYIFFLFIEL